MLIQCPECELQVSDKAFACPHCGYPMTAKPRQYKRPAKRRRLPNGFGQISEIKNQNLRKPFRVLVTVGKTQEGKFITKPLKPSAYFETYNDAYAALIEYNRNPYDLDQDITVKELYEKWAEEHFKSLARDSSVRSCTSAWAYCSELYDMRAKDIRPRHIKSVMENGTVVIEKGRNKGTVKHPTPGIKERIKSMFNLMYDYATEYEIVDKNYARAFDVSSELHSEIEKSKRSHIPFTDKEINRLWQGVGKTIVIDMILVQCYSGWRPDELCELKISNVDIEKWSFTGGSKTQAGINRTIPIHSRIRPIVLQRYNQAKELGSEYLFNCTDTKTHKESTRMTYDKYNYRFMQLVQELELNPEHRPHDPRVHFITNGKKSGIDEMALKIMVGHKITDITESAYTKRDLEWNRSEIEKIK